MGLCVDKIDAFIKIAVEVMQKQLQTAKVGEEKDFRQRISKYNDGSVRNPIVPEEFVSIHSVKRIERCFLSIICHSEPEF